MKRSKLFDFVALSLFIGIFGSCSAIMGPEIKKVRSFGPPEADIKKEENMEERKINSVIFLVNANVREGPGSDFKIIGEAKKGEQLELIESNVEWAKIKLSNGLMGWVYRKLVREITKS